MCCQLGSLLKERSFWWKENSREDSTWISLVGQERHVLITCARPEEQAFVFNLMFKSSIYDIEERRQPGKPQLTIWEALLGVYKPGVIFGPVESQRHDSIDITWVFHRRSRKPATVLQKQAHRIGTIDASQRQEFEVTFVLVSQTTPFTTEEGRKRLTYENDPTEFIEDKKRINVALSRTKQLCVVLLHEQSASSLEIWRRLIAHLSRMDVIVVIMGQSQDVKAHMEKKMEQILHHADIAARRLMEAKKEEEL
uniref:AAA_12 domain-containing protein n=1 Tax=Caenorhabditis tropicalis TaxID=1561998 RepID=A0A1I7TGJ3_9PELO